MALRFTLFSILCLFSLGKVHAQAPVISSFSPASGPAGTVATLSGSNFNTNPGGNIVYFGATKANVTVASASQLKVILPTGATYQPITALNLANNLTGYSTLPFITTFTGNHKLSPMEFNRPVLFPSGIIPISSNIADIDQDGKPDLIVACKNSGAVSIYRNASVTGNIDTGSFAPKIDFGLNGLFPSAVAVGDLDGDGKPDLVISYNGYSGSGFAILRNTSTPGNISFSAPVTFATNGTPSSLMIGDIDGDGKPDLVALTTNSGITTLSVFSNTSASGNINNTSFSNRIDLNTNSAATSLCLGDMDADGKLDIVLVNGNNNTISLMHNTTAAGVVSFDPKVDFTTGSFPQNVSIGDLNGDGKPDLAVTNYGDNTVSIYVNTTQKGAFTSSSLIVKSDIPTGLNPGLVNIMDVDGDGKPDILTGNTGSGTVSIIHNTTVSGSNIVSSDARVDTYVQSKDYIGASINAFCLGDIDGDGKPELVVLNDFVSVYYNNPQFAPIINSFSPASGPVGLSVVITGNGFNPNPSANIVYFGSGKATVTSASATKLTVTAPSGSSYQPLTALNSANGLTGCFVNPFITTFSSKYAIASGDFSQKATISDKNTPGAFDIGDIDGDGKPDIAVSYYQSDSLAIYRNISAGGKVAFAAPVNLATGGQPGSVKIADMDGDGKPDIILINNGVISIYLNKSSTGTIMTSSFAAPVTLTVNDAPGLLAIADINGDGKPDLIVTSTSNENQISLIQNNSTPGNLSFAPYTLLEPAGTPTALSVIDMDGDGKPDIVLANGSNILSIFRNISNGSGISPASFAGRQDITLPYSFTAITAGDLNGDSKPDIVVMGTYSAPFILGSNTALTLLNTSTVGNISFTPKGFNALGQGSLVSLADMDGDGKPDIVVHGGTGVTVLRNSSTGSTLNFSPNTDIVLQKNAGTVLIADMDGDGKPDFVARDPSADVISVWINNPLPSPAALPAPPVISTLTATAAPYYSTIQLTGQNFNPDASLNRVVFGATDGKITNASTNSLSVIVPPGSTLSQVSVLNLASNLAGISETQFIPTLKIPQKIDPSSYGTKRFLTTDQSVATVVADMNGDGIPDLVSLVATGGNTGFSVYTGINSTASFSYSSGKSFGNSDNNRTGLSVADIDGDGKPDVILFGTEQGVTIYLNTSAGQSINFATGITIMAGASAISIADVDGDGKPDIAVSVPGGVTLLLNASNPGTVAFPVQTFIETGNTPLAVQLMDLDGDGKPDLVSSAGGGDSTYAFVYLNQSGKGGVSFSMPSFINIGTGPRVVAGITDMDGDGKPDILSTTDRSDYGESLTVTRNTSSKGKLSFASVQVFSITTATGIINKNIAIGDIDGDGKPDIVVDINGSSAPLLSQVVILHNTSATGHINLDAPLALTTDPSPLQVSVADLDGDGKPEILFDRVSDVNENPGGLEFFTNGNLTISTSFYTAFDDPATGKPQDIDTALTVKSSLPFTLKQATISITQNFNPAEDSLIFNSVPAKTGDIAGSYDSKKGILTLTSATATIVQLQNALQAVSYKNSNQIIPDTNTRVVSFVFTNGTDTSNTALKYVRVGPGAFNAIPVQTYGAPDLSIDTGDGTIIYTSSNTAVATIAAGKIHITGTGSSTITASNGITTATRLLTVNPALLTITADNKASISGTPLPAFTFTYSGFVNGDSQSSLTALPMATTTATSASGTGYYPITVTGGTDPNYTITDVAGRLTMVTQSFLEAPIITTYGDADFYTFTSATTGVSYSSNNTAVATVSSVGLVHIVGAGTTTITFGESSGHLTKNITVSPAALTITADNKTGIGGTPLPVFTFTYTGFVNGDSQSNLTDLPNATTTATSASGTGYYPITVTGGTSPNYTITDVNGRLTMVTQAYLKAPITTTYGDADFYTFGSVTTGVTYSSSNSNVATVSQTGLIHIVSAGTINITFGNANGTLNKSLTVNPAALTITANNQTKTAGAANPILTVSYSGFVNGDSQSSLTTQPAITTMATTGSVAGTYAITASGAVDADYTITYVSGILTVSSASGHDIALTNALLPQSGTNITGPEVCPAVSPNGDGVNDVLTIANISKYPDNKLTVINPGGAVVFEAANYDNTSSVFDGHSNTTRQMQKPGTYFYVLQYKDSGITKTKTGYIVIKY